MDKINIQFDEAFRLGQDLVFLVNEISQYNVPVGEICDTLQKLSTALKEKNLSPETQNEISRAINEFEKKYPETDQKLPEIDCRILLHRIVVWNDRLTNELRSIIAIPIFTEGILNTEKLLMGRKPSLPLKSGKECLVSQNTISMKQLDAY